jgi:DNA invertase Pin-like site-specific DNA recombinase
MYYLRQYWKEGGFMRKLLGYARVSTNDQDLTTQINDLKKAGCKMVYTDVASGVRANRPGLEACLNNLRSGDTLFVWRLDRLGRSMPHLVTLIEKLQRQRIGFKSLGDGAIDTTTASGDLVFNIFSALAQFERRLIQERTKAGLAAARARGRLGGRKPVDPKNPKVRMAQKMHQDRSLSIGEICESLRISRPTLYRYLKLKSEKSS